MSDEKFVVISKANANDSDYVRAVVHETEDSANEYLAEIKASTPWQDHRVVKATDFAAESEKAVEAEKNPQPEPVPTDPASPVPTDNPNAYHAGEGSN